MRSCMWWAVAAEASSLWTATVCSPDTPLELLLKTTGYKDTVLRVRSCVDIEISV
jgi:hypothetical protein